jgi:hypothetical protein
MRVYDAAIDAAVRERVRLHAERKGGALTVVEYKAGLVAVREVEDALEPARTALGAERARRFDLTTRATTPERLRDEMPARERVA